MIPELAVPAFWWLRAFHIVIGSAGLLSFWIPMFAAKGGTLHQRVGRVFGLAMLATGTLAIGISGVTLLAPLPTHPAQSDPVLVRGIFGWMMQYLGILTINLAWYGWSCVRNRRNHLANRDWRNLALQAAVILAALNVAVRGVLIHQPLMIGISTIGFATGATNLWFLYRPVSDRRAWTCEHLKGFVGAGISVYTAFFAFGAVHTIPALALNPLLWSVPLITGLWIIIVQWHRLGRRVIPWLAVR